MWATDGSVSGGSPMVNSRAVAPKTAPRQLQVNGNNRTLLNTYIYDYFLHYGMLDCACAILNSDSKVKVQKHSRDSSLGKKGGLLGNDLRHGSIDPGLDSNHPEHLPAPNVPNLSPDICFLYVWFCLFWDIFNARTDKGASSQANHVSHLQLLSFAILLWFGRIANTVHNNRTSQSRTLAARRPKIPRWCRTLLTGPPSRLSTIPARWVQVTWRPGLLALKLAVEAIGPCKSIRFSCCGWSNKIRKSL